jgi:hypothetical protein
VASTTTQFRSRFAGVATKVFICRPERVAAVSRIRPGDIYTPARL